ncbi:unnamed protein product [Brachionus calyciflorus]|uniref:DUF6570 domain-containing protein n=1 Tax=Brachionus calyciflorus TaxID=104777 RepID=A0A814N145_9BILA|nr:unnamed protein product [Brachionus calyciflorus]
MEVFLKFRKERKKNSLIDLIVQCTILSPIFSKEPNSSLISSSIETTDKILNQAFIIDSNQEQFKLTTPKRKTDSVIEECTHRSKSPFISSTSPIISSLNNMHLNRSIRQRVEKCKCGKTDHSYTSSFKCPLNKLIKNPSVTKTNTSSIQRSLFEPLPIVSTDNEQFVINQNLNIAFLYEPLPIINLTNCRCGSASHKSIRNINCPLNKKNNNSVNQITHPTIHIAFRENFVSKEIYLKEFNADKNGPLHKQPWVTQEIKKFHESMREYESFYCNDCSELWPTKLAKCETCYAAPKRYTNFNDMNPDHHLLNDEIKKCLYNLTMIEEMLISPILPVMSVYHLTGGQLVSKGFVINFKQDISPLVKSLPRLINDLPVLIVKKNGCKNNSKEFKRESEIIFKETQNTVIAVILLKRND